jgi:hypothetical protein
MSATDGKQQLGTPTADQGEAHRLGDSRGNGVCGGGRRRGLSLEGANQAGEGGEEGAAAHGQYGTSAPSIRPRRTRR